MNDMKKLIEDPVKPDDTPFITDMPVYLTTKEKADATATLRAYRTELKDTDLEKLKLIKRQDLKDELLKIHKMDKQAYDGSGLSR
jgi:hypothetical protein